MNEAVMEARKSEYEICKRRGHESDGTGMAELIHGGRTWYTCKWCGTEYAITTTTKTELHERKVPG